MLSGAQYQAEFDASYLVIKKISLPSKKLELEFNIAPRHPVMGNKLTVYFPDPLPDRTKVDVLIEYETTKECTALGWLEAQQTGSGKYPFLYSQCQAIHCRSLLREFPPYSPILPDTNRIPIQT
jgi:leukotriene-A4 hydrolase